MLFQKILVAVDSEPIAAHAADIGAELARLSGAEMAFIHVIDPALVNAADTGIQPDVFLAAAKEVLRQRFGIEHLTLQIEPAGEDCSTGSCALKLIPSSSLASRSFKALVKCNLCAAPMTNCEPSCLARRTRGD